MAHRQVGTRNSYKPLRREEWPWPIFDGSRLAIRAFLLSALILATLSASNALGAPGAFTLTNATPGCNGSSPQIRLNWTASSGVSTYDVYRNGSLYSPGVPAGTLTFLNTGSNVTPGATYTYFIRARNSSGFTDSGSLQATAPSNCGGTLPGSFTLTDATPGCNGSSPQIRLYWTTSSNATTYDVYRNGSLYSAGVPAGTLTFLNTGSNVTPGATYTYFIRARNSTGTRDSGLLQATAPSNCGGTLPGSFTLTDATPGCNGSSPQIRLYWTTSSNATTYDVYRNGSLYSSGVPAGTLTFLNTGSNVTPGTTYTYFIRARNATGTRDSGSLQATAPSDCGGILPGAFTLTDATPSCNGSSPQIRLYWTASSNATTYDVYRDGSLYSPGVPAGTLTFLNTGSNVTPGATYTYFIRARNASGTRDSGSLQATAPSGCGGALPGAFALTDAIANCNGSSPQIRLYWTTSSNAVTYDVYRDGNLYSPGVPAGTLTFLNTGSNVTPGATYTYFIRARNTSGTRDSGSLQATAPPNCSTASIPGAPQNLVASAGNGQNVLSWSAPSSNGGATITNYRVFRGTTSGNRQIVTSGGCASLGAVFNCTDTGLTNGQSYDYVVSAVNSVGQGPPSNAATATPNVSGSVPSAPRNLSASAGNAQITLSWSVPSSNGGATITNYRVFRGTTSANRQIVTSGGCAGLGAVSSCTDTGLTNGQSYDYVVSAVNSVGQGAPSNAATAMPNASATVPGAPRNLAATAGNAQATLSWSVPSSNGGATITNYRVFRGTTSANRQIVTSGGCAGLGAVSSCTDTGLTNGQSYDYVVSAVNSVGQGAPSNAATAMPNASATVPGAPRNLAATAGNAQATLSWSMPSSNGGATITNYRVFRGTTSANRQIVTVGDCANLGAVFNCTDTGLTNGQSYDYVVSAVNSAGQGAPSNAATVIPVAATTVPGPPRNLAASAGNARVTLSWSAPSSNGGATITSYRVFRGTTSANRQLVTSGGCAGLGAVLACSDTGLTNGQSYDYVVYALNGAGQGAASNSDTAIPSSQPAQTPDLLPRDLSLDRTAGAAGSAVVVTFTIVNSGGGSASASRAEIRLSSSSSNVTTQDPRLADIDVPALSAGASFPVQKSVTIPSSTSGGTRYLWAIVDAGRSAGQADADTANDRVKATFIVNPENPNTPSIAFTADPDTVNFGQSSTLRWTTTNASSVSIDNGIGGRPVNGEEIVKPLRTTTYTLTAIGPGGTLSAKATITVRDAINEVTLGGIRFTADSIARTSDGYTLTGSVMIHGVLSYSGTLTLRNADTSGNFRMEGAGVLRLTRQSGGSIVLYDGTFSLRYRDGQIFDFLEQYSRFSAGGWKFRIDRLGFIADGVHLAGSLRVPQYASGLSALSLSATADVTTTRGIELAGSLRISRIGLAGGFWLENVEISYNRPTNIFEGSGTLRTATLGIGIAVRVIDGCPNSGSVTISRIPIVLGTSGLQLVNYGVDATGLCRATPFGVGLHTDITILKNPDPDLLSFADVNAMYFPLTTLSGGGKVRFLYRDMVNAKIFFNYVDSEIDCDDGLCFETLLAIPRPEEAWIVGNLEARVMLSPFRIYGSPRLAFQIPKSCWDLDIGVAKFLCPMLSKYCDGKYPCVLGEMKASLTVQPEGDPVAIIAGKTSVFGHSIGVTTTFSEGNDRRFHLHLGSGDAARTARLNGSGEREILVPRGATDVYAALSSDAGTALPEVTLVSPSGARFTSSGGRGVDYFEDVAHGAAVFALQNPEPGTWKVIGAEADVLTHVAEGESFVAIRDVSPAGRDFRIEWQTKDAGSVSVVTLTYAGSLTGPDLGVIAEALPARNTPEVTSWSTVSVPSGTYYVRARILDPAGTSHSHTFPNAVNVVDASAPAPPANLQSAVSGADVTLTWQPSPTASTTGYVIRQRSGASTAATDIPVGDALTYTATNLDTRKGYSFTAVAHDAEGRQSAPGNAVTASWTRCTIAAVPRVPSVVTRGDVNEFAVETQMQGGCGQSPTYAWTFGDGATGSGAEFSHTYVQSGTYPWSVIVTSGDATSTATGTIRVEENRCTIRVDRPSGGTALEPGRVTLVAWSMDGPCSGDVRLDVIRDGVFVETVESSTHGTFTSWTPPGRLGGAKYYLRISDVANPAYVGLSQEFTISDPPKRRATRH